MYDSRKKFAWKAWRMKYCRLDDIRSQTFWRVQIFDWDLATTPSPCRRKLIHQNMMWAPSYRYCRTESRENGREGHHRVLIEKSVLEFNWSCWLSVGLSLRGVVATTESLQLTHTLVVVWCMNVSGAVHGLRGTTQPTNGCTNRRLTSRGRCSLPTLLSGT